MDFQIISVGLIVLAALIYIGFNVKRKMKNFSSKSACEMDCGCAGKKSKTAKI